jgi:hypothetical protein
MHFLLKYYILQWFVLSASSFTQFHQDGHGTVDSGHLCCRGYNEVVMLRRLPERHKLHALHLLNGTSFSSGSFLYGKPHDLVRSKSFLAKLAKVPTFISLVFRNMRHYGLQTKQSKNARRWGKSLCICSLTPF